MKKPSGRVWVSHFSGSHSVDLLSQPFRDNVKRFLESVKNAGINVVITFTLRPPERAYLMHWLWKLFRNLVMPKHIPYKMV